MVKYYEGSKLLRDDGIDSPQWVYHPNLGSKIVDASELPGLFAEGWHDNPAFIGKEGIDETPAPAKVVKKPNFAIMSKADLVTYAKTELGMELVPDSLTKAAMIEVITNA